MSSINPNSPEKIVIIGAGLAGLSAAHELKKTHEVQILEARERTGGRVFTVDDGASNPIELGANWIHGTSAENPLSKLIDEQGLSGTTGHDTSYTIYKGGKKIGLAEKVLIAKKIDDIEAMESKLAAQNTTDESRETSHQEILDQAEESVKKAAWVKSGIEDAAKLRKLIITQEENTPPSEKTFTGYSDIYWDSEKEEWVPLFYHSHEGKELLVTNGLNKAVDAFSNEVDIKLGAVVKKIQQTASKVFISYERMGEEITVEADRVIVTVPVSLLQRGEIEFQPKLSSEKVNAISQMKLGNVHKLILTFDKPYWIKDDTHWIVLGDKKLDNCLTLLNLNKSNRNTNTLVAWFVGDEAVRSQQLSEEELLKETLEKISKHYPECTQDRLVHVHSKPWGNDPFARGAWSYLPTGSSIACVRQMQTPEGRVHFAGEHTDLAFGTMHAAIESGRRAATEVQKV